MEAHVGAMSGSWATRQSHLLAALQALSDSSPMKGLEAYNLGHLFPPDLCVPSACPLNPNVLEMKVFAVSGSKGRRR